MPVAALTRTLRPLALIGLLGGIATTTADTDLWGHLRFGLDILNSGHVAAGVDPYSFTQDHPFVYHEWLGGTIMAAAYRAGGVAGLVVLKALLATAIFALVWRTVRHARFAWRWAGMALAAYGTLTLILSLRPQIWTGLLLVVVCRLLTARSTSVVWALPPIFALWANLHGGWIVGGGVVAVWTLVGILQRSDARWHLAGAATLSLAATLLTPYGAGLWTFLIDTVRLGRDGITEWQPVWRAGWPIAALWMLTVVTVIVSLHRRWRSSLATTLILAGLAYSAAHVSRMNPLFVLVSLTLLAPAWPTDDAHEVAPGWPHAVLDAGSVMVVLATAAWLQLIPPCVSFRTDFGPDSEAAESLRGAHGRLVTSFNWGEYALWHFGPALKVSIDARRETLYTERTVNEQLAIADGNADGLRALARIAPDYVWLPSTSWKTEQWLRTHGYREDVRTARSFVAVRRGLPPLQRWQGTATGCFPGP